MPDDEARAALWREQQRRLLAYQAELWHSLAGSAAARQALMDAWGPIIAWQLEREEPDLGPEDYPLFDPYGLSEQVNV
jgi:hypothetical protein